MFRKGLFQSSYKSTKKSVICHYNDSVKITEVVEI